jgi:CspA family cold shock protein
MSQEQLGQELNRRGIVKFYDKVKGFGFIMEARNPEDIFVHATNLECKSLDKGDEVAFNTKPGRKGEKAVNVIILN